MSTSRNPDFGGVNTIPAAPPEEQRGGELVPVGSNYSLTPYTGPAWGGGLAARPELLSAAPDPMSMLRAFRRRWPLACGLGILAALAAMAATWFLLPEKGNVVAYIKVDRNQDMLAKVARTDSDFTTLRATVIEMMKSKFVLTRALRDSAIAQLPVVRKQKDAVDWLQSELMLKYPGDAEILQITMEGEHLDQLAKIVNAVVAAYFKEVVESERQDMVRKDDQLKRLHQEKEDALTRELQLLKQVQNAVGALDAEAAARRISLLTMELQTANGLVTGLSAQVMNIENEIEHFKLELEMAQDSSANDARMEEEYRKDERLKKLEEDLGKVELAIADMRQTLKTKDSPAMQRALKTKATYEEQIAERKEEVAKRFTDAHQQLKVKDFKGKLANHEKHKKMVEEQLDKQKERAQKLTEDLMTITNNSGDLEAKKHTIRALELEIADLKNELYRMWIERHSPPRMKEIEKAVAGAPSMTRKYALVGFNGVAIFVLVGLVVSFFEFQARRISSSTQLVDGLGLRVVGALPSIARPGRKALAAANGDLNRLLIESIDTVRTNLIHSAGGEPVRVVMVTSALDREGKTTVSSQLAASLARCGRRTILVDGDLRRPTAHRLFELPLEPGLCEVLRGEAEIEDVIRPTRVAGLWMISAGQYDLESIQALSKSGIGEMFDTLRARFDFVVVDSAPVLSIADASMMGQHVDVAILCVMRDVSQAAKVYEASEQLRSVGVHVLGTVINGERTAATYRAYSGKA